jgi:AcrR family transcriptional regulator
VTGRTGRRPGDSGTRQAILEAAGRQFSELGYDRTSMRSVAQEAGVDPALIVHFFANKSRLFVEAVGPPVDPQLLVDALSSTPLDQAGEQLARLFVAILDNPQARRRVTGLVRAAASEPEAARLVRDLVSREILTRVVEALGVDDGERRAALVGSQLIGLVMARVVVGVEPLVEMTAEEIVAALAPTLQRYLSGPLDAS